MDMSNQYSEPTSKFSEEINGLLELGHGMTRLARGVKLLQSLISKGVATPEVDSLVRRRRAQREKILGKMSKNRSVDTDAEDQHHKEQLMNLRIKEAKRDWLEARSAFRRE